MLFAELPTEIIQQILHYLPPESFLAVSQTSKHLRDVTNTPLLWRHFCRTQYKYWDPRHDFDASLARPVEAVPWKDWYIARRVLDRHVLLLLDRIINHVQDRIEMIEVLVNIESKVPMHGSKHLWDIKDALLKQMACDDDAEDVLARRFWAKAALDRLHRARAIRMWAALKDETQTVSLETVLAAYDMFVEGLEDADCGDVGQLVNKIADSFRTENPEFESWTIRQKARSLAMFLRAQGFRGAQDVFYHNLPNNFICRALLDPEHPALPIICVAIYCAVAERIGINASPCGFPMHVYAVVESEPGLSLDRGTLPADSPPQRMYIDAFRPEVEVPLGHLTAQLASMGAGGSNEIYLGPASSTEIALRTSRNIMHSVRMAQTRPSANGVYTDTVGWPDTDTSLYAALWVSMMLQEESATHGQQHQERHRMRHHLPFLCEQFQSYFPWDAELFEEHVLPQLLGFPEHQQLLQILGVVRAADRNRKPQQRRGEGSAAREGVKYKIGHVFNHKRFRYQGVVIGWDVACDASEEWMTAMGVDQLGRGRYQSFYHVLAEDKSNRYVAEDNIVLTQDAPSEALLKLAGRYFRRYDKGSRTFVSNIREEYPDD